MQALEGMDAAFLSLETPTTPMHVGVVLVLDPPEGSRSLFSPSTRYAQIRRVIEQRLHLVPPFRQRAVRVLLGLHHAVWADDPDFAVDDHLTRASLPAPGGRRSSTTSSQRSMGRQLDPDRPLWEMHVVEGLEASGRRWWSRCTTRSSTGSAASSSSPPSSISGPARTVVALPTEWRPGPLPSTAQVLRHAAGSLARQPGETRGHDEGGRRDDGRAGAAQAGAPGRGERAAAGILRRAPDVVQRRSVEPQALRFALGSPRRRQAGRPRLRGNGDRRRDGDGVSGGLRRLLATRANL